MVEETIKVDYSASNNNPSSPDLDNQNFINSKFMEQHKIKKHGKVVPTYKPVSFQEQFYFYDDGVNRYLYIYINNVWRKTSLT